MVCDECGKNMATVHLTKIINGKKTEMHLCEECAKKYKEFDFESPFSIHQFLAGLLDNVQDETMKINNIYETKCEQCGMTYAKFKQTGKLGCKECYNSYRDKLVPLFKRIHGHEEHIGKVPKKAGSKIRKRKEVERLKKQLNIAIEKEEFEEAAKLRDRIKELQNKAD